MRSEFGLFVVWAEADHLRSRLLDALAEQFEIRGVHRITWSPPLVAENFGRFYRSSRLTPPFQTYFQHQKGSGAFTVVAVLDPEPTFAQRQTSHGPQVVNTRLFDLKREFRQLAGGRMVIHATDTASEAIRDAYMLLGAAPAAYLASHQRRWDGSVEVLHRDLTGASGWASLREVFEALNTLVSHVVLRNFEGLPGTHVLGEHDDVDLLVADYHEAIRVLNARPYVGLVPRWGGRFKVVVAGRPVTFDIRFVGDGYFDGAWQRDVLDRRRLSESGVFVPTERDYFETLAYHAIVHKRGLSPDYSRRLAEMAAALRVDGWTPDCLERPGEPQRLVDGLVRGQGRRHVRPNDITVFYDFAGAGWDRAWARRKLAGLRRAAETRWWRIKAAVTGAALEARYTVVRRYPVLRRLRRWPASA